MTMPFQSHSSYMPMPCGSYYNMPYYFYLSWSFNSYMPFSLRYFCSDYIIHKESEINKSPPANNDRIDHKNWSVQKKKHKVIKQVYHVKKDGRLIKNSDLTLDKEKPIVKETSASSVDQMEIEFQRINGTKIKFGRGARRSQSDWF